MKCVGLLRKDFTMDVGDNQIEAIECGVEVRDDRQPFFGVIVEDHLTSKHRFLAANVRGNLGQNQRDSGVLPVGK